MAVQQERAVVDLVINGRQSEASLKDITKASINARKALASMAETDPGYAKQKRELEALMRAQQQRIVRIHEEKTAWQKFKDQGAGIMQGVVGGNLVTTGIQKLLELGPVVIDHQLKIRDSFADIAKAADLSDSEVADLNEQLKKLDTRTPTEELRNMAVVGGQFGVAKKDLEGFVESADKLNVALGDQFDSAEKVAETALGLRNTFQDMKSDRIDEDMMKIGNGLNYLEAQGAATAPVMADFSSRIGGVAIPLGLTSGQVLGLSATLQELNITAERGSSAMVDILSGITKAPATFAKYARGVDGAKLSTAQFKDLINTDLNAAFMAVIRGFKEGDTSATGMAAKLADMDIKGNGVLEIFMKLASNTELLTQRQDQSAEALTNTSSITGEFAKKNFELATNLKKLKEAGEGWLMKLAPIAEGVLSLMVSVMGLNRETAQGTKNFDQQKAKVAELEKNLGPLVKRYDELANSNKRSREEQAEMKKITDQIAAAMPAAITQFDKYGNAIGISTDRIREMVKAQKELQQQLKADALEEQQARLRGIAKERKDALEQINKREQVELLENGKVRVTPLNQAAIDARRTQLQKLQKEEAEVQAKINELEGKTPAPKPSAPKTDKPKPNADFGTTETEEEKKAREKKEKADARAGKKRVKDANQDAIELSRMLAEGRAREADAAGRDYEKEQIQFGEKYKKMFELAGKNKAQMAQVTEQMYAELEAIVNRHEQKELRKAYDQNTTQLEQYKDQAENQIELAVLFGSKTRQQADEEKLRLEEQSLMASELLNRAYFKTLEELNQDNAEKLGKIQTDKQEALLKIEKQKLQNAQAQRAVKQAPIDKAYDRDQSDLQKKHDEEILQLKDRARRGVITEVEARNQELAIERTFLNQKKQLIEQHYQALARLGVLSAEEQQTLERQKNQAILDIDGQLLDAQQKQYDGQLGKVLKFLDEKQQYMNEAVSIMQGLFKPDQEKLSVGPLLNELDQLQQKTSLTSSEQERMQTIIAQVGKVMPDAVTGTNQYGEAISINTSAARQEVDAQKSRANILHKVMLAQRAWALASVGISYGEAIMAAVASAKGIPFPGNLLAIAAGIGKATLTNGAAVAQILGAKIETPQFAAGGFTPSDASPSGYTSGPTFYRKRNFIAGEKGQEWIMSAPMLGNPVMADIAGTLQALQVSGDYKKMSYGSGSMSGGSRSGGNDTSTQMLAAIYQQLQLNNERMEAIGNRPVQNSINYHLLNDTFNEVDYIQQSNKL